MMHDDEFARPRSALPMCLALVFLMGCGAHPVEVAPYAGPPLGGVGPQVYQLAAPGVVRIEAGLHTGAGIVVGPGEVLTAAHVVRDVHRIEVTTLGASTALEARLIGYDEPLDLALLEVPGLDATSLPLSEASPAPGHEIWAVGHPNAQAWSIARGVISHSDPMTGALLSSLAAEPGSSGGPVLVYGDGDGDAGAGMVEVVGIVSRVLPAQGQGPAAVVPAPVIAGALERLRAGARVGLSDPQAFVATAHNRSPLVHDVLLAQRVAIDGPGEDVLAQVHDTLSFAAFPVTHTLELRTTWRYFFAGTHTFRYRVVRIDAAGALEPIHEGPLRTFELTGDRTSYVHKVEIDVDLPAAGDYAVLVETNERLSSVLPFYVVEKGQATPPGPPPPWPFQGEPLQHALIAASRIEGSTLDQPAGAEPVAQPVTIHGTFNTVRLPADPGARRVRFDTWTLWSGAFAGAHRFEHILIDATGQTIARGVGGEFTLETSREAHEHVARWDVEFPASGLYFLLALTDGRITRAMPIWVQ